MSVLMPILVIFTTAIMFPRHYEGFGMPDLWNPNVDVDDVVVGGVGHPHHHHYHYSFVLKVIFQRYYGEFGMQDF